MIDTGMAALLYTFLTAIVVLFQVALAFGAPWGEWTMGGKYPGVLPEKMRKAAGAQIVILLIFTLIVLSRAGVIFPEWIKLSHTLIWVVTAFFVLGTVLNIITPSKKERMLWAPVNMLMLLCAISVALS